MAGNIFCVLTMQTGSSLPTYVPAMLCSRSVDAESIGSPSFVYTESTTYLPGYIRAASRIGLSCHISSSAILPFSTSITFITTPLARLLLTMSPVLLSASTNILYMG